MIKPYTPHPTSIVAKVIAHLKAQPSGTEVSAAVLADELDFPQKDFSAVTATAIKRGLINRRRHDGILVFSLGSGVPLPTPEEDQDEDEGTKPAQDKHSLPNPCNASIFALGASVNVLHTGNDQPADVADVVTPCAGVSSPSTAQTQSDVWVEAMSKTWVVPDPAVVVKSFPSAARDPEPKPIIVAPIAPTKPAAAAIPAAYEDDFVCAVWSDGRLTIYMDGQELTLSRARFAKLVQHLDVMSGAAVANAN